MVSNGSDHGRHGHACVFGSWQGISTPEEYPNASPGLFRGRSHPRRLVCIESADAGPIRSHGLDCGHWHYKKLLFINCYSLIICLWSSRQFPRVVSFHSSATTDMVHRRLTDRGQQPWQVDHYCLLPEMREADRSRIHRKVSRTVDETSSMPWASARRSQLYGNHEQKSLCPMNRLANCGEGIGARPPCLHAMPARGRHPEGRKIAHSFTRSRCFLWRLAITYRAGRHL